MAESSGSAGGAPGSSAPSARTRPMGRLLPVCKDAPAPTYLCSHCKLLLREAVRSRCGHRYCAACLAWIVRHYNNPICQSCKEEEPGTINEEGLLSVEKAFSDAAINKEISELSVHCGIPGCSWTGVMKSLEDHQSTCDYAPIPCHVGCSEVVMRKKLADHLQNCPNATPSSDCNQKSSSSKHQNLSMASVSERSCRFSRIGCLFKGDAEDRNGHEKKAVGIHLALLLQHIMRLRGTLCPAGGGGSTRLTDSNVLMGSFNVKFQGAAEEDWYPRLPLHEEETSWRTHLRGENGVSLLERKLQVCQDIVSVLSKEMGTSRQTIMAFRGLNQDMIHGLELKAANLQRCLAEKDVALGRLEDRLHLCEQASYDGIFLWKITDVHRKCYEAACGKTCSLQSPAFYTSRYGYKLCMRIYLNGEGRDQGTHVSLFIVLLRGHLYVAQSKRRRPSSKCDPPRPSIHFVSEACDRHERCQRLSPVHSFGQITVTKICLYKRQHPFPQVCHRRQVVNPFIGAGGKLRAASGNLMRWRAVLHLQQGTFAHCSYES